MNSKAEHPAHKGPELAKLTRPKATRLLDRSRLWKHLDEIHRNGATWITAPPGFGKTSLVSSYVAHCRLPCLWYRIDESNADCGSFFHYLYQAGMRFPHGATDLPRFTPNDLAEVGAFGRRFFESLFQRLPSPALLVFDDCQTVPADSPLHDIVSHVLASLPHDQHILFLSRESPPAAYARVRTHGALAGLVLLLPRSRQPLPDAMPDATTQQILFDHFSFVIWRP